MRATFRNRLFALVPVAAAAVLLSFPGCSPEAVQGGTDTETLTGLMLTTQGKPAANARVKLIPSAYDPSRPDTAQIRVAVTDASGRYAFPKAKAAGSYNLLAAGTAGDALFHADLPSDSVPDTLRLDTARVFYLSLFGDTHAYDPGRAWFPGTDLLVRCEADSTLKWKGVPRSLNALVVESEAGWRHDYTIKVPGDTLIIMANPIDVQCFAPRSMP